MSVAVALAAALGRGDRRALAKAITLVESLREEDRASSHELLSLLAAPPPHASFRLGVTGVPGAGKSTLIEALGLEAIAAGKRVAVLAVDPSSKQSGGSVLGDKTRMTRLSAASAAFVRPSPTLGVLGGTSARTREVIFLCEAAGYDFVFVETVGVGQSEEQVASMVDCVLLVLLTGAGDELSSMKRGVLEAADVIAFNKADGERALFARNEATALRASLSIGNGDDSGRRVPPVMTTSALDGSGISALWEALCQRRLSAEHAGSFDQRRAAQRNAWLESALESALRRVLVNRPDLVTARQAAERRVESGELTPWQAADELVAGWLPHRRPEIIAPDGSGNDG